MFRGKSQKELEFQVHFKINSSSVRKEVIVHLHSV